MRHGFLASVGALAVAIAVVSLAPVPISGQVPSAVAKAGTTANTGPALKTPWGEPDLQGVWDYLTLTPLERPRELAGKQVFTDEEAAEFEKQALYNDDRDRRDDDPSRAGRVDVNGAPVIADVARAYNEFWNDRNVRGANLVGTKRTSLIVDPPDGRKPPLTPEAQKGEAARAAARQRPAVGPEDRPPSERCIHQTRTGPPMAPGSYNNHVQLLQTPGYVVLFTEQIHDARIIPLDGRPHIADDIRQWKGDSRGRWEGNTLVVDTINFNGKLNFEGSGENLHLVERFTRVDADTLNYEYTMNDPASFTRPWTVQLPMRKTENRIYEYACHEGNYGIPSTLRGARAIEKAAEEAAIKGLK